MSDIEQPILIMTGMHRSGTSLTSSLLASAGLDIGRVLLEAGEGNPRGHFENLSILRFHEDILYSLGIDKVGWTSSNKLTPPPSFLPQVYEIIKENKSLTQPWGWKEPRTTLFLDFWADILPNARFLLIYRRPWEVIDSIYRRGDMIFHQNPQLAIQAWDSYNQAILDFYQNNSDRCLIINLNQIIADPSNLIDKIEEKLGIYLNKPKTEIYEQDLLVHKTSESPHRPWIIKNYFPASLEIYHQLNQITNYEDPVISELTETPDLDLWTLNDWLKVHLLGRQLKNQYSHIEKISQELTEIEQELAEKKQLEEDLKESRQQQQELNAEKKQLEQNLKESRQQQQELNTEKKQLEQKLKESHQQQQELNFDLEELHYYNNELTVRNKELNQNLEQLKEKYSESEANLAEFQQELAESKADLEQLRFQINQINCLLEEYDISTQENHHKYSQLNDYVKKLEQESMENKLELERILTKERSHLEQAQQKIEAMETSKFWQLRKQWFKLKKTVGLGDDD